MYNKILLILLIGIWSCANPVSSNPPKTGKQKINLCYSSASLTQATALYAYDQDIFSKYGLDVNLIYIKSGSRATAALVAGDADIGVIAGSSVVNAVVSGIDLKIIAGLVNTYPYQFIVRPEINTPADLKGKAIAISNFGSSSDVAVNTLLTSLGLKPHQDVAILSIGGQSERIAAMNTGQIVGTLVDALQANYGKKTGFKLLADMRSLELPYQHTALVTSGAFLKENRTSVENCLKALLEAMTKMKEDPEGFAKSLAKHLLLDYEQDKLVLENAVKEWNDNFLLTSSLYPSTEGVQVLLNSIEAIDKSTAPISPSAIIDSSLLKEILKQ